MAREGWRMSKDKKKHEVVEAPDASGKINRKQFEEELRSFRWS